MVSTFVRSGPQNRDENIDYYIAKPDELVKKFGGVTGKFGAVITKSGFWGAHRPNILLGTTLAATTGTMVSSRLQ